MSRLAHLDLPALASVSGRVQLPGSKSISNRVLLLAGLAAGETRLHGLLDSDDTRVMLAALRQLGCALRHEADGALVVQGLAGRLAVHEAALFLGNAGTAMRPLAATLAVLAATQGGRFTLAGVPRMHERPIGDLVDALRPLGCTVEELGTPGYPPLRVSGTAGGRLAVAGGQPIRVRGDVSSQFLTALLLALPLASTEGPVVVEVAGELISKPYIDITLNLLARFGIAVEREGFARFTIPQGSAYRSPGSLHVEGDASSASYFIAAGAIAAHGGAPLVIEGVGLDSIQGDIAFVEAARAMGAVVAGGPGRLAVHRGAWPLRAITLDCTAIPDAAMTLAAMALYATGTTVLTGIASWRVKETDRIAAMAAELRKLGATVEAGDDRIAVTPPPSPAAWRDARIATYDDHRMAMCLSLAAFHPLAGVPPRVVRIEDPSCTAKTFPGYFDALFGVAQAVPGAVPVIAIDGPTASGKGTLASAVAARLGWHLLDSGALYRATALTALQAGVALDDAAGLARLAARLDLRFDDAARTHLAGADVTDALRREDVGMAASRIAAHGAVREALHGLQLAFRRAPGLVADGRDMGTVVFPGAPLKVFLTAGAAERAGRRHKQLMAKGIPSNIDSLRAELEARDLRDKTRQVAPLVPAQDALLLDNSALTVEESVDRVLGWWEQRRPDAIRSR